MKIADIDLGERPLMLAPMEDVTDVGFRRLCKRYGAAMYHQYLLSNLIIFGDYLWYILSLLPLRP